MYTGTVKRRLLSWFGLAVRHFYKLVSRRFFPRLRLTFLFKTSSLRTLPQIREHILDWVLYREDERILRSYTVGHNVSSDHFPILCYLNITKPRPLPAFRVSRNIRAICGPDFKANIAASVASPSEPTTTQLNEQLSSLLDRHAPVVRREVATPGPSPWYADVCEELPNVSDVEHRGGG